IGDGSCLGFSRDGSLFFATRTEFTEARVMDLDTNSWKVKGEPRRVSTRFTNINEAPVWSPDGKRLASVSHRPTPRGEVTYVIRDVASSEESEFSVPLDPAPIARGFRWFPDGQGLLLGEYAQANGRFRRLDLTDGSVRTLFRPRPGRQGFWGSVSIDGRAV